MDSLTGLVSRNNEPTSRRNGSDRTMNPLKDVKTLRHSASDTALNWSGDSNLLCTCSEHQQGFHTVIRGDLALNRRSDTIAGFDQGMSIAAPFNETELPPKPRPCLRSPSEHHWSHPGNRNELAERLREVARVSGYDSAATGVLDDDEIPTARRLINLSERE